MPTTNYGKPITIKEAQACMDRYKEIMITVGARLTSLTETPGTAATIGTGSLTSLNQYFGKKGNAFIFDRELITRFFENEDRKGNTADYLVVLMGAQPADDKNDLTIKANDPTVIVVGCTLGDDGQFYSLDVDDPATEHPPVVVQPSFPPRDPGTMLPMSVKFQLI